MFNVYVPAEGSALGIDPGSAIVGSPSSEWFDYESDRDDEMLVIDYEGRRYNQANMVTFADKCVHAAGRHKDHYPTVARLTVPADRVIRVATFHEQIERVEIDGQGDEPEGNCLVKLARWIGLVEERDGLADFINSDQLHRELRGTSIRAR